MKSYVQINHAFRTLALVLMTLITPSLAQARVGVGQTSGFALVWRIRLWILTTSLRWWWSM